VTDILDKLRGGDRRSIGRSEEVVVDVLRAPGLFGRLVSGLMDADPLVRMRSADAVEKTTREHPDWLAPYKELLLDQVAAIEQPEVRWHVAQMLPRLDLSAVEVSQVQTTLERYLADRSRIVQVEAMQALGHLAEIWPGLTERVVSLIEEKVQGGGPAVRSRGRRLLARLGATDGEERAHGGARRA
jgi:hypothetical protein